MTKQKNSINLDILKAVRLEALKLNEEIDFVSKVKEDLVLKLLNIRHNCEHEIVVRYNNVQTGREVRCLCCDKAFYGNIVGADFYFKNIIDFQSLETQEDKVKLALTLIERERNENPELSISEIIEIINNKTQGNKLVAKKQLFVKTIVKK